MINRLLLFALLLFSFSAATAQFERVQYDYEKNWFGENQELPAETSWMLSGVLPPDITIVAVEIYAKPARKKPPLHRAVWSKALGNQNQANFYIPVTYNLRGNSKYTLEIKYYRATTPVEMANLKRQVYNAARAYIQLNVVASRNDVELKQNPKMMIKDLNKLMNDGLVLFQNELNIPFPGFSDLVLNQLENMDELNLKKSRFNILKNDSTTIENNRKITYFKNQLENLQTAVKREIDQYLSYDFSILEISRLIPNYETEETRTVIPINVGYAAIHNEGGFDSNIDYDSSPYVGVSFPLANPNFSGKFWSHSSISAGVFINNLEFDNGYEYTGPLIGRPFYLAYGYKTAYFLRFNIGATLLENTNGNNTLLVRPFIGLSVEINLWLGLER